MVTSTTSPDTVPINVICPPLSSGIHGSVLEIFFGSWVLWKTCLRKMLSCTAFHVWFQESLISLQQKGCLLPRCIKSGTLAQLKKEEVALSTNCIPSYAAWIASSLFSQGLSFCSMLPTAGDHVFCITVVLMLLCTFLSIVY